MIVLILLIIVVVLLMILSFFFSSADMVYSVVDVNKLERHAKKKNSIRHALELAKNYENTVSTILFGNNLVNILLSSITTVIAINYIPLDYGNFLLVALLTVLVVIFCEFAPKAISRKYSYKLAIIYAYPILFFKFLFFIFVWPIGNLFKHTVGRLFYKKSKEEDVIDESVLSEIVDSVEESGDIEEDEANLVQNAIYLSDIEAHEIMTPRVDIYALEVNDDIDERMKEKEFFIHSRIPVYEDSIDNIIGFIPLKTIQEHLFNNEPYDIKNNVIPCLKVPKNHQVLDLLNEFKTSKIHLAVVIDEYGGTDGIVTMEDILEEIVGDIFDENDVATVEVKTLSDGHYIVDGSMNIDDFFDLLGLDEEENESDSVTVNGFIIDLLDRFAKENDELDYKGYHFKVLEAEDYTINALEVIKLKQEDE